MLDMKSKKMYVYGIKEYLTVYRGLFLVLLGSRGRF